MITQDLKKALNHLHAEQIFTGKFGFEKENIRVDQHGKLALTPHPKALGDKTKHPYITTDFSESQIETITPPLESVDEALGFLETLHDLVSCNLHDEYLWPQSSPPTLPEREEDIPIAHFGGEHTEQENYRLQLAKIYGRKRQMFSGIHFNISFSERVLQLLHKELGADQDYEKFREDLYMKTVRNFLQYRWFIVALLGASPLIHKSYRKHCIDILSSHTEDSYHFPHAASMRNNICGYRNNGELYLDYSSLENYRKSLDELVEKKILRDVRENYAPIRIKSLNGEKRINHLEMRLLDLNPFVKMGLEPEHAKICHIFIIYCLLRPEELTLTPEILHTANENQEQAASESLERSTRIYDATDNSWPIEERLASCLERIRGIVEDILPVNYQKSFRALEELVQNPKKRAAHRILNEVAHHGYSNWHMQQAQEYLQQSQQQSFAFHGLRDMELSSQLLLRRAALRGVAFEILDRHENFVQLKQNDHTEYVMQATRTSLDNYISVLSMENKEITKKLLDRAGIATPSGRSYSSPAAAAADYIYYRDGNIVIKPKSTNFGLGITIIKDACSQDFYQKGVELAFAHDSTILIEKFIPGKEYRFFIVGNQVAGILHRVPANITGDGTSNIQELVQHKNLDPLRGKGYRTPLEKIQLNEAESMFLQSQGYDFTTVPAKDERVFLRENSNISTGGDSIDVSELIPESYKKIALQAAEALRVKITGLDMMIQNIEDEANKSNYSIIEMNFNPAIHIHCHPYRGKNRHLDDKILDALGF